MLRENIGLIAGRKEPSDPMFSRRSSAFDTTKLGALKYWLGDKFYEQSLKLSSTRSKAKHRLVALATGELWVREKTGHNDGDRVEEYLRSVGLQKGQPWCAAFVSFVFRQAGYSTPRTGWSPSLFPVSKLVKAAAPGNVFGIYFPALKRIAHCGIVARAQGAWVSAIEGNTGGDGSREGDGVYRRVRHRRTIYKYADWTQ